jgi:hypothetical protein
VFNGRERARGGEPRRVDVQETLDALERRLDELEAELAGGVVDAEEGYRILLEALTDIHALSALERALTESPRVRTVELQAYAGGWASLVVDVS